MRGRQAPGRARARATSPTRPPSESSSSTAPPGCHSLDALAAAGAGNLVGKVLIDVATPLDFSRGIPPRLGVCNTDSLGDQIQRAFPQTKVVKALNTMYLLLWLRLFGALQTGDFNAKLVR
jgi:hypothetical protein